jgi:MFS family permease
VLQELNAQGQQNTGVDALTCLIWLTLGAFAIGTEGFMIAGLLPALARDLNVGVPAAGHLVTAFSLAYAIGAPVMAVLTAGLERRRLLAVAMGGFTLANLLAELAPGYAGLLAARLLLALSAASFMPAASGYAAALGGPERRGRALSMVINGLTLAIIAGVPLGVLVGQGFGWRATFLGVAGLAAFSLLGILTRLPRQPPGATASLGERLALAKRGDMLAVLATSVLTVAGTFTVYTYLGVFLARVAGLGPQGLALVLLGFGLASAVGHSARRHRSGPLGRAPYRDPWWGPCPAGLRCPLARRGARARARNAGPAAGHPALGPGQLGADHGAAGAAGRAGSGPGAGQPLAQLLGHLPRQRDGRGSGRAGHRRWRSGTARLDGGGVQPGRAVGGAGQRQHSVRPRLMPSVRTAVRRAARAGGGRRHSPVGEATSTSSSTSVKVVRPPTTSFCSMQFATHRERKRPSNRQVRQSAMH